MTAQMFDTIFSIRLLTVRFGLAAGPVSWTRILAGMADVWGSGN
jgi:hypothetical protein